MLFLSETPTNTPEAGISKISFYCASAERAHPEGRGSMDVLRVRCVVLCRIVLCWVVLSRVVLGRAVPSCVVL